MDSSMTEEQQQLRRSARDFAEGDWLTLDGDHGAVHAGRLDVVIERPIVELAIIARWRAAEISSSANLAAPAHA